MQALRAQKSALQASLAHAEARATAAQSRADAAEHEVLRKKGEKGDKGATGVASGTEPAAAAQEEGI